jgi:thiamine-monophosphate kinase
MKHSGLKQSEFDVIKKYFTFSYSRPDVILAGGDDCAIVSVPENKRLVVTTDTLISGVHFPVETTPEDIAYKALMVNLSDLAAMGATPAWVTLAISLPEIDDNWLSAFSKQFSAVLSAFNIVLIGGDTTRGSLSITVQAMGFCDTEKILRRDQAQAGDKIYITGSLGDAAIGLHVLVNNINDEKLSASIERLNRPAARVGFAQELVEHSTCAIDISDGLVADLGHIIKASGCGAKINLADIPLSSCAQYYFDKYHQNSIDWSMVLTQGDDYELCFVSNVENKTDIEKLAKKHQLTVTCIGEITDSNSLKIYDDKGNLKLFSNTGFMHF